jgi:hypothetical protein
MSFVYIALVAVLVAAGVFVLLYVRRRKTPLLSRRAARTAYSKVLVVTVDRHFSAEAVALAAGMTDRDGVLETLYVLEIPLNRPMGGETESGLAEGMEALEEAARIARGYGVSALPRLERSRRSSTTVVELQRKEAHDLVVTALQLDAPSQKEQRRIVEYIQENVTCPVVVLSERSGA